MPERTPFTIPDPEGNINYPEGEFDGLIFSGAIGAKSPEIFLLRAAAKEKLCTLHEDQIGNGIIVVRAKFADESARSKYLKALEVLVRDEGKYASDIYKRYDSLETPSDSESLS